MPATPQPTEWNLDVPWSRQPCDTEDAWRAFTIWLLLPPPGDTETLAQATGYPPALIDRWRTEGHWDLRGKAYRRGGKVQDAQYLQGQYMAALGGILVSISLAEAAKYRRMSAEAEAPIMSTLDWIRTLRAGAQFHKEAQELPQTPSDAGDFDESNLTAEELEQLSALLGKAYGNPVI